MKLTCCVLYPRARAALVLYQAAMYHSDVCGALSDDAALELCDWCCRRLLHLNTAGREHAHMPGTSFRSSTLPSAGSEPALFCAQL